MKKIILAGLFIALAAIGCQKKVTEQPQPIACAQDAELCPGGTYVSRVPPDCKFAACPEEQLKPSIQESGIIGVTVASPACPVQRPSDPGCDSKPIQVSMIVKTEDGTKEIARFQSTVFGAFKVIVPPGTYLLVPVVTDTYPTTKPITVTVREGQLTNITIGFDSGIR